MLRVATLARAAASPATAAVRSRGASNSQGAWALAVAGGAAAAAVTQAQMQRRQRCLAKCDVDWVSAALGAAVVSGGIFLALQYGEGEKKVPSFEKRLKRAYNTSAAARAALADAPYAHPDLVKASVVEQKDVQDKGLAVANHIRELWCEVLAEAFHFPKTFFISTNKPLRGQMMPDKNRHGGVSKSVGKYKVAISSLKHNKVAVRMGVDKLAEVFDRNGDGVLDFHEFATLVLVQADFTAEKQGHNKRSKAEILKLLYSVLDDDGDQKVTREEFESFMVMAAKLGIAQTYELATYSSLWSKYDADGNGLLSYSEFVVFARDLLDLSGFPGAFPVA